MKRCRYCHQVADDEVRECAGCGARDWERGDRELKRIEEIKIADNPYGDFRRITRAEIANRYNDYRDTPPPVIPEDPRIKSYADIIKDLSRNSELSRRRIEAQENKIAILESIGIVFEILIIVSWYLLLLSTGLLNYP